MRPIAELRGLRFPDEYVVKMFFKEGLHRRSGEVLELGCGSAKLSHAVRRFRLGRHGIDNNTVSLANAAHNLEGAGTLIECDLSAWTPDFAAHTFDATLLPSVNYYVPRAASCTARDMPHCSQARGDLLHTVAAAGRLALRSRQRGRAGCLSSRMS